LIQALSPKGLGRAFRGKASALAPEEVSQLVQSTVERLEARIGELLGLTRRAGALTVGMDAVCRKIEAAPAGLVVVVAKDVAERSRRRVMSVIPTESPIQTVAGPTRSEMGAALGRQTVGVASVEHPVLGRRLIQEAARLAVLENVALEQAAPNERPRREATPKTRLND